MVLPALRQISPDSDFEAKVSRDRNVGVGEVQSARIRVDAVAHQGVVEHGQAAVGGLPHVPVDLHILDGLGGLGNRRTEGKQEAKETCSTRDATILGVPAHAKFLPLGETLIESLAPGK